MLNSEIWILAGTAASLGLIHTVIGPDHYVPFIAMSRARRWSMAKTLTIAGLAGLGHVMGSIVLGFIGIAFGIAVSRLEGAEAARGGAAAWLMIGFGFAYFLWGLWRAGKGKHHHHIHAHAAGPPHEHEHSHVPDHIHLHAEDPVHEAEPARPAKANITPWILFTIFVFGPCEPLIPLIMYPAAKHSLGGVAIVAGVFGLVTIGTMLAIIGLSSWGVRSLRLGRLERYAHALAGGVIVLSGLAVRFLGL